MEIDVKKKIWVRVVDNIEDRRGYLYIIREGKTGGVTALIKIYNSLKEAEEKYMASDDALMDDRGIREYYLGRIYYWMAGVVTAMEEVCPEDPSANKLIEVHKDEIPVFKLSNKFSILDDVSVEDLVNAFLGHDESLLRLLEEKVFPQLEDYTMKFMRLGDNQSQGTRIDAHARVLCEKRLRKVGNALCKVNDLNPFALGRILRTYTDQIKAVFEAEARRYEAENMINKRLSEERIKELESQVEALKRDKEDTVRQLTNLYQSTISSMERRYAMSEGQLRNEIEKLRNERERIRREYELKYEQRLKSLKEQYDALFKDLKAKRNELVEREKKLREMISKAKENERRLIEGEIARLKRTISKLEEQIDEYESTITHLNMEKSSLEQKLRVIDALMDGRREGHIIPKSVGKAFEVKFIARFERKIEELLGGDLEIYDPIRDKFIKATKDNGERIEFGSNASDLPTNKAVMYIFEDKHLFSFSTATRVAIGVRYVSHRYQLKKYGVDSIMFSLTDIVEHIKWLERMGKRENMHIYFGLASSTGWTDDAIAYIEGRGAQEPFTSKYVSLVLIDISPAKYGRLYFNRDDPHLKSIITCFKQTLESELEERVERVKDDIMKYIKRDGLKSIDIKSAKEYLQYAHDDDVIYMAFYQIADENPRIKFVNGDKLIVIKR